MAGALPPTAQNSTVSAGPREELGGRGFPGLGILVCCARGLQFPEIEAGCGDESTRSQPLDQWSVTRALALLALQKKFLTKMKSNETKYLLRRKEYSTCGWHVGRLRKEIVESRPHDSLNYFCGVFLLGFLWPLVLICLVHRPCLVYLRVLPCVCMYLLAKMDLTAKASG